MTRGSTILIVIAGDPVERTQRERGNFAELIRQTLGEAWRGSWRDVDLRQGELPPPSDFAGVIVTGSPARVQDRDDWTVRGEEYLRRCVAEGAPVLGICYGHQMLGQALGGHVAPNPRGREIGTVHLEQAALDPLIGETPHYTVNSTHLDSIVELPRGATVLARTELEPHAAVRFSERVWGVQFHPEIDGEVMKHYVHARKDAIDREGLDADAILDAAQDTPLGAAVIERFVRFAL